MKIDGNKLFETLCMIAKKAYIEGREHQLEDDFPDYEKKFEDTVIYKLILKGRKNYERN